MSMLSGKKTFLICSAAIVWAILGVSLGYMDPAEGLNVVLAALGAAGLRDAMKK